MQNLEDGADCSLYSYLDQEIDQEKVLVVQDCSGINSEESLPMYAFSRQPVHNPVNNYPPEFEELWKTYPRKTAKKKALRAWQARLRAVPEREAGALHDEIRAAVLNYAAHCRPEMGRGVPDDKIMHPSTFWGPDERWKDWLEPKTRKPRGWNKL